MRNVLVRAGTNFRIGPRIMTKIEEIEKAVEQLSPAEMARFRAWFAEFQGRLLDERIEADVMAGRLDWLAEEALAEHAQGKTRKID